MDVAASAKDALRMLTEADSKDPYALVLMDWHMPGMDGLEASRVIKSPGRLQHTPRIVIVTAFGREDVRTEAEQVGVNGYLLKPVNASVMYDTLMDLFGEHPGDGSDVAARRARSRATTSAERGFCWWKTTI